MEIKKITKIGEKEDVVILIHSEKDLSLYGFSKEELAYLKEEIKKDNKQISINRYSYSILVAFLPAKKVDYKVKEEARKAGCNIINSLNKKKINAVSLLSKSEAIAYFIEGMILTNYQFLKYKSDKKTNSLNTIKVVDGISKEEIEELVAITTATNYARNLVNEPLSFLNAVQFSEEIKSLGKEAGFKVEVLNKSKIESLKMGGLLAVNKGSIDPPTFSIMEWKPKNAKNKKPLVLVGKGIVYDTGGLSLKPTPNSMDLMKSDMGGAAAVIGALYAIAKNNLPVHVIGLIPATDNRPGGNAYAPGDVITMHNQKTVEVLNTDAEGRLILADALSYANKYQPELIIDAATLTGAAARAIGYYGVVAMGNANEKDMKKLKASGENVYERIVEFPFWDEYGALIKSDIADLKNVGGAAGGAITAGKFLEHFTDYPYIHLDIAGPAFMDKQVDYIPKGGSGVGVRLFYNYVKNY